MLERIIRNIRDREGQYDCVVGFSGGKDSSFLLYELKTKHDLKVLALTLDTGWMTEYAIRNQKIVCEALGIDHIVFKPRWDFWKELTICSLQDLPFCRICNSAISSVLPKMASKIGIRLVVSGESPEQTGGSAFTEIEELLRPKRMNDLDPDWPWRTYHDFHLNLCREQIGDKKTLENVEDGLRSLYMWSNGIDVDLPGYFRYFGLAPYDEHSIIETLSTELGWIPPSRVHEDCEIEPLSAYIQLKNSEYCFGFYDLAGQVRMGRITKKEAEEEVSNRLSNAKEPEDLVTLAATRLGMSCEEFRRRMIPFNRIPMSWILGAQPETPLTAADHETEDTHIRSDI
jgi:hypothetical protein